MNLSLNFELRMHVLPLDLPSKLGTHPISKSQEIGSIILPSLLKLC